jgi:small subunit ribosomal protein S16
MSVKIRLSRLGKKNRPYWRIIAVDHKNKRDGAYLDNLGTYDPIKHELVQINVEKIKDWVSKGAICSATVSRIMKAYAAPKKVV